MEYRRLGNSGLEVSPICLGTMMFGDRTDAAAAQGIVDAAFAAGVNFIDTADAYAAGESERMLGEALKHLGVTRKDVPVTVAPLGLTMRLTAPVTLHVRVLAAPALSVAGEAVKLPMTGGLPATSMTEAVAVTDPKLLVAVST